MTPIPTHEENVGAAGRSAPFSLETTDLRPVKNGRRGLLIEASAGTGKTYTLERVVERVLSDERYALEPKHLLVVTFTRAATAELRQRLKHALAKKAAEDCAVARSRLAASRFDEATVVTIDGLWNLILNEYALTLGEGSNVEICPDEKEVMREALRQGAETVLKRRCSSNDAGGPVPISPETEKLLFDGRLVPKLAELMEHPELIFEDCFKDLSSLASSPGAIDAALVYETLVAAKATFDRIMREHGWVTYGEARRRVVSGVGREALCEALRARFRCVLIDEFQDTDRAQLAVFETLFLSGNSSSEGADPVIIFVGDPKQAIYRFRGADIQAYLEAREGMAARAELPKNWRSAPQLVRALNVLFDTPAARRALESDVWAPTTSTTEQTENSDGAELPFFTPVEPMGSDEATAHVLRLRDASGSIPPVRIFAQTEELKKVTGGNNDAVLRRMTAEIRSLLSSAELQRSDALNNERKLHPGDFAVLVRNNNEVKAAAKVLDEAGLPVTANTDGNIFARVEALELLEVLRALAAPGDYRKFTAAALGTIGGLTPAEATVASVDAAANESPRETARRLEALERRRAFAESLGETLDALQRSGKSAEGLSAALDSLFEARSLKERLLRKPDGRERIAVFEKLVRRLDEFHGALGLEGCVSALEAHIRDALAADPNDPVAPEDAMPVVYEGGRIRVMTMHKSKGLEFPVVFLPFAELPEHGVKPSSLSPSAVAGAIAQLDRTRAALVFGGLPADPKNPAESEIVERLVASELKEQMAEELRLLYVAMTRAKSHLVLFTRTYGKNVRCALDVLLTGANRPSGDSSSTESCVDDDACSNDAVPTALERAIGMTHPVLAWKSRRLDSTLLEVATLSAEEFPEKIPPDDPTAPDDQAAPDLDDISALEGLVRPVVQALRRSSFTSLAAANPPAPSLVADEDAGMENAPSAADTFKGDEIDSIDAAQDDPDALNLKMDEFEAGAEETEGGAQTDAAPERTVAVGGVKSETKTELPPELRLPRGAAAGTAMHELFERIDFATGGMPDGAPIEEATSMAFEHTMGSAPADIVCVASDMVRSVLRTRLAEHKGEPFALSEVARSARRSEMSFAIRVAQGVTARHINAALGAYDPAYAFTTNEGASRFELGGFLTGSIDLAFTHGGKWWIVDWKSNVVASGPDALPVTREDVAREMASHRYHLQYLLYLVAYRRWLRSRWVAAGLDAAEIERLVEASYGGVYYVFIRWLGVGQKPSDSGSPAGLYYARPAGAFLDALDALLDGRGLPEGDEHAVLGKLAERFGALRGKAGKASVERSQPIVSHE